VSEDAGIEPRTVATYLGYGTPLCSIRTLVFLPRVVFKFPYLGAFYPHPWDKGIMKETAEEENKQICRQKQLRVRVHSRVQ
jgi:hypothetical protein